MHSRSFRHFGLGLGLACLACCLTLAMGGRSRRRLWWSLQQRWLRRRLIDSADLIDPASVRLVGGVDISFVKDSATEACAALVVLDLESKAVVHSVCRDIALTEEYLAGYLAFRECPHLLALLEELRAAHPHLMPHVVLVDGNGILHPAGFGSASQLGVLAGIPSIGVGKTLPAHCDGITKETVSACSAQLHAIGDASNLVGESGRTWGAVLRTTAPEREASFNPVLVSVGHGLSLQTAVAIVRRCTVHRVPEPVRQADLRSRAWLREREASDARHAISPARTPARRTPSSGRVRRLEL